MVLAHIPLFCLFGLGLLPLALGGPHSGWVLLLQLIFSGHTQAVTTLLNPVKPTV